MNNEKYMSGALTNGVFKLYESEKTNRLQIESIGLNAKIKTGTDSNNLNKNIGHFEMTPVISGNTCLAAHNRGFDVNYFEKIHLLKNGDKIKYLVNGICYVYKVIDKKEISDEDWSVLYGTNEKYLTLITCIKNKPDKRLAVRAEYIDTKVNMNN